MKPQRAEDHRRYDCTAYLSCLKQAAITDEPAFCEGCLNYQKAAIDRTIDPRGSLLLLEAIENDAISIVLSSIASPDKRRNDDFINSLDWLRHSTDPAIKRLVRLIDTKQFVRLKKIVSRLAYTGGAR